MSVTPMPNIDNGNTDARWLAHQWANRGIPVFPAEITWDATKYQGAGGTDKRPLTTHGHKDATTNHDEIDQLFNAAQPRPGGIIGCALLPGPAGYVVLDCDRKGGKNGIVTAERLGLPETWRATTPSGGEHRIYRLPANTHVTNHSPWADDGIDIRANDGWIIAPGIHTPWGAWQKADSDYTWPDDIAPLPQPILDRLRTRTPNTNSGSTVGWTRLTPQQRDDLHPATHTALQRVEQLGGHNPIHKTQPGREPWVEITRPGKRHGTSATIGYLSPGVVNCFTPNWPHLNPGIHELDDDNQLHQPTTHTMDDWPEDTPPPFDPASIDATLSKLVDNDLAAIIDGNLEPEQPTIQPVGDRHLLYPNRANVIYGESGIGKTWLTYSIAHTHLTNGQSVIILDWEDTPHNLIRRLAALGTPRTTLTDQTRLRHINVNTPLGTPELAYAHRLANELHGHTLIIFDAAADAIALDGYDEDNNTEVTRWWHHVITPLLRSQHTILLVDHQTTKNPGIDKGRGARGASAKVALTDGAVYEAKVVTGFSKDQPGELKLVVQKDRHGAVGAVKSVAAHVHATPDNGRLHLVWTAGQGTGGTFRPTELMRRISDWLAARPGVEVSQTAIVEGVKGNEKDLKDALEVLVREGYIAVSNGPRNALIHRLVRPYHDPRQPPPDPRQAGVPDPRLASIEAGEAVVTAAPPPPPTERPTCPDCNHRLERGGHCPWCDHTDTTDDWIGL